MSADRQSNDTKCIRLATEHYLRGVTFILEGGPRNFYNQKKAMKKNHMT